MDSKEQPPVVTTVTRAKHPGRVAQGKRLANLMKQRRADLLQNKQPEQGSELTSEQGSELTSEQSTRTLLCSGGWVGAGVLAVVGIALYLYICRKPPPPRTARAETTQPKKYMD